MELAHSHSGGLESIPLERQIGRFIGTFLWLTCLVKLYTADMPCEFQRCPSHVWLAHEHTPETAGSFSLRCGRPQRRPDLDGDTSLNVLDLVFGDADVAASHCG